MRKYLTEYKLILIVGCISHKCKLHQVLGRLNNIATLSPLIIVNTLYLHGI